MRLVLIAGFLLASPVCADGFETKADCLQEFADATTLARQYETIPAYQARKIEKAPESTISDQQRVNAAWQAIANAYAEMSDALFEICAAYD